MKGRRHSSTHHYVAERFFGRSANSKGTLREPIFVECPWGQEGQSQVFCYCRLSAQRENAVATVIRLDRHLDETMGEQEKVSVD